MLLVIGWMLVGDTQCLGLLVEGYAGDSSLDTDFYKFHFKGISSPFNGLSVGPVSPDYLYGITTCYNQY